MNPSTNHEEALCSTCNPITLTEILDFGHSTSLWSLSHWQFWKHCWRYRLSSKQFLESESSLGQAILWIWFHSEHGRQVRSGLPVLICGLGNFVISQSLCRTFEKKRVGQETSGGWNSYFRINSPMCNCIDKSYCQLTGSCGKIRDATGSCCQLRWVVSEEMIRAASNWIYWRRCGGGAGFEPATFGLSALDSWGNWKDRNTSLPNTLGFIESLIIWPIVNEKKLKYKMENFVPICAINCFNPLEITELFID